MANVAAPITGGRRSVDRATLLAVSAALPVWVAVALVGTPFFAEPIGVWHWLVIGCVMPVVEELAFRGFLQPVLARKLPVGPRALPVSSANLLTSLLFTAAHMGVGHPWVLAMFVPSLVFGALRDHHGHPWSAVGVHCVYNLGFLAVCMAFQPPGSLGAGSLG